MWLSLVTQQDTETLWPGLNLHTHLDKVCMETESMELRMDADSAHFRRLPPFAYRPNPCSLAKEGRAHMLLPYLLFSLCAKHSLGRSLGTPLTESLLSTGRGDTFTINCSGFDQDGVDPAAFQAVFDRKAFRPVVNYSIPIQVNISFTMSAILEVVSPDPTLQWSSDKQWVS